MATKVKTRAQLLLEIADLEGQNGDLERQKKELREKYEALHAHFFDIKEKVEEREMKIEALEADIVLFKTIAGTLLERA